MKKYESENDDYSKIMAQALADRFVEAFAEYLHREIRIDLWGYAKDECLDEADLLKVKYDGIRPAPVTHRSPLTLRSPPCGMLSR